MKNKTAHVVLAAGENGIRCEHCGVVSRYTLPIPVPELVKRIDAFVKEHRRCRARETPAPIVVPDNRVDTSGTTRQ